MKRTRPRLRPSLVACGMLAVAAAATGACASDNAPAQIRPGDARFDMPAFEDFEAQYTSSSSKTGAFTLQVRNVSEGAKIHIMDVIPMPDNVIVAFRSIDASSQQVEMSVGPYFAWGAEFMIQQATAEGYDLVRVPIGGGEPLRRIGETPLGGAVAHMFSPALAALMPMPVGARFQLADLEPRKDETMANVFADYEVVGREALALASGVRCECWVLETNASGMRSRLWVARSAPFVFKWHRDIGGSRELVSEVLGFRPL